MSLPKKRKITPDELDDLKALTRRILDIARPTKFALVTRVDAPMLSRYGAPSEPEKFMPIDIAIEVCRDLESPAIVEEMARMLGYRLVPLAEAEVIGRNVGVADIAAVSKEANDVVGTIARGLADGKLDGAETREARKEIAENIRTLHQLDRKLAGGE